MGGDVATLVVRVEGVVKTDNVNEPGGSAEAHLVGHVPREVLVGLERGHVGGAGEVGVAVDTCRHRGVQKLKTYAVLQSERSWTYAQQW